MSTTIVNSLNSERNGGEKAIPNHSSSITTIAKSSAATVTASAKKSRKSDANTSIDNSNLLPIAPQQQTTFFSPNQGLALASVQQQQLSSGGMAVFSSPTMMATLGTGPQGQQQGAPQPGQQLVVTVSGQPMGQAFNSPNGQGIIQTAQGVSMIGGLPQMQNLQMIPNGSQPTYTIQPLYTNHGMQPMILGSNLVFPQNTGQGLAIHKPQTVNNSNTSRAQVQQNAQQANNGTTQTLIQSGAFQQGPGNQTFVITPYPGSTPTQTNGNTTLSSVPTTNSRKSGGSRSSSSNNKQGAGTNLIQKIQPATANLTSPIIAPAQCKPNSSPYQTAPNGTAQANGQTIMVHGQSIQGGTGIQLGPNQTIISPLTQFSTLPSGLTWTTGGPINQQPTQLVTPNGQHIFFRTSGQTGDQPQMFIQTSNNQFQAVQMQMAQNAQSQTNTPMTQGGQPMVTTSMSQPLPTIMQPNPSPVTPTAIVNPQTNIPVSTNLLTSASSVQSSNSSTTTTTNRNRLIRPANTQLTMSNQNACKPKTINETTSRTINNSGNIPKLAPKNITVSSSGMIVNAVPRVTNQLPLTSAGKLPLPPISKASNDSLSQTSKSIATSTSTIIIGRANSTTSVNSSSTQVGKSVQSGKVTSSPVSSTTTVTTTSLPPTSISTSTSNTNSTAGSTMNNLVNTQSTVQPLKSSSPVPPAIGKFNRKIDRPPVKSANASTNANLLPSNTQMINGVLCHVQTNTQTKALNTYGPIKSNMPNGSILKTNNIVQKGTATSKSKPKQQENQVLTHVIDGYVIQESCNPFPVNGFTTEFDNPAENISQTNNTELSCKSESKENVQVVSNGPMVKTSDIPNVIPSKENATLNGVSIKLNNGITTDSKLGSVAGVKRPTNVKEHGTLPSQEKRAKLVASPLTTKPENKLGNISGVKWPINMKDQGTLPSQDVRTKLVPSSLTIKSETNSNNKSQTNSLPKQSDISSTKEPIDNTTTTNNIQTELDGLWLPPGNKDPNKWTVQEVYEFIYHLEGCSEFAEDFKNQEIDGQALMLIKEDHIIAILHMKLGPALKICRKIKDLKSVFNI